LIIDAPEIMNYSSDGMNKFPTPYDDVNETIHALRDGAKEVLGDYFTGMYLYGSLALGDFDPERSDIDPLIVTSVELPDDIISELEEMHRRLYRSHLEWAKKMSGIYIPLEDLRVYDLTGPKKMMYNRDEFLVDRPDIDWVFHRHVLYTCGVVIEGPPLKDIIEPIPSERLREAAFIFLRDWVLLTYDDEIFQGEGHQAYFVLTVCRCLYTFRNGEITTKHKSAEWVLNHIDDKWSDLIRQAMSWRFGDPAGDIPQTQKFMRYIMAKAGVMI
jgi:predicted nucleotidyltransferase